MSDEKGEKCVLGRLGSAGLMLGLDELRRFSQSQWLCAAVRAGGTPQSMLWAAEHRAAGRRELFEEHFSPLHLTQRVPVWMEKCDREVYLLQGPAHEGNSKRGKVERCGALCFSVHQFCFFTWASITYLLGIPWIPFVCGIVTPNPVSGDLQYSKAFAAVLILSSLTLLRILPLTSK